MKKKILIAFLIILLITISGVIYVNINSKNEIKNKENQTNQETNYQEKNIEKTEVKKEKKISDLKKKLALKGLINKGDIHLQNQEYTIALTKYLKIHRDLPDDESIIKKIGDSYFYLKKYKQAYKYYSKIKGSEQLDKSLASLSIIYSNKLDKENFENINTELKSLNINDDKLFYYSNSLKCIDEYQICLENFENKFNETGTGILIEELESLKTAFKNYENSKTDKSEDLAYKNALIAGSFFENAIYPISINIGENILSENSDYKAVLKIVAKSYYELGDYIKAKEYLLKYKKLDTNNADIIYFLGIVHEKLNEDVLSIIHLDKAIKLGYKDSLTARKRMIYAYYSMGEIDKMLKVFKDTYTENKEELQIYDLDMAIYYHILNNDLETANEIADYAITKFSESEVFYTYSAWIGIETLGGKINKLKIDKIEENIEKALKINNKNVMINYVKGKLELIKGDNKKAYIYFKKSVNIDYNGDFGKIAQDELDKLELIK